MRRILPLVFVLILSACDSGSGDEEPASFFSAQLIMDGLIALDGGASYEAWGRVDGEWLSITRFNYDAEGRLVDAGGRLVANTFVTDFDLAGATEILVSIEGRRDSDANPSDTQVLRGPVVGTAAALTFGNAVADMSSIAASYTIGTPTDADAGNEQFGVWLGTPGTYQPAMTAPDLGAGWQYELWIDFDSGPTSLGKFSDPADRDLANPFSSQPEVFGVPGEDLLRNAPVGETFPLAVAGRTIYVTVEPNPDDFEDTAYGIRVLQAEIPAGATPGGSAQMTAVAQLPIGNVTFR
ncbi:MAG: hypothetical protein JJ896_07025 [Rhodothermales bacterium]|nr:hypothetical protein [Rhodothermales bacterium]MBO6779390.1 hypothetical protein [Rhodothermales bacterium]